MSSGNNNNPDEEPPVFFYKSIKRKTLQLVRYLREKGWSREIFIGEAKEQLSVDICEYIKIPKTYKYTVMYSLASFDNLELTDKVLSCIALKINGNLDLLKQNKIIPQWNTPESTLWIPVKIVDAERKVSQKGNILIKAKALVLSGIPAGQYITQTFPDKYVKYLLKEIGLPKYDKVNSLELFGCVFTVKLGLQNGRVLMLQYSSSSSEKAYNKDLRKHRKNCPLKQTWFCDVCPYGLDICQFAVRQKSLEKRLCKNGHIGFFNKKNNGDKQVYSEYCVTCEYVMAQNKK